MLVRLFLMGTASDLNGSSQAMDWACSLGAALSAIRVSKLWLLYRASTTDRGPRLRMRFQKKQPTRLPTPGPSTPP